MVEVSRGGRISFHYSPFFMKISFSNLNTGEPIDGKSWNLNPKQELFMKSPKKVVLFSGGFGSGKTLCLILKAIELSLRYPNNFIMLGRRTYRELEDTLIKQFFDICPRELMEKYNKAELKVTFPNRSEIVFRHLDKLSSNEIKSMNLGAAGIDQAEDIPKELFLAIKGRLRRDGITEGDRRLYMTMNPELTWHFADFKQNRPPEYDLIESSTLDNQANLPKEYIEDLLKYPEEYKRQYVFGVWDETLLSRSAVLAPEQIVSLARSVEEPSKEMEGIMIYRDFVPGHKYQMGIDVAEGNIEEEMSSKKDQSSIVLADLSTLEEVAHWSGQLSPDAVAAKAIWLARRYQNESTQYVTVVPEMNSIGLALLNILKVEDDILIYQREEFDKNSNKRTKKLGWRTTRQSKPLLVNRFQELIRLGIIPKIRTASTIEQFKTFVHTGDSKKSGFGAKQGFHDDRVIATLLAFWEAAGAAGGGKVLTNLSQNGKIEDKDRPSLTIVNGVARLKTSGNFSDAFSNDKGICWITK